MYILLFSQKHLQPPKVQGYVLAESHLGFHKSGIWKNLN